MQCKGCLAHLKEGSKFCHSCGAKVVIERKCVECNHLLDHNEVFCSQCGAKGKSEEQVRGNSIGNMIASTTSRIDSFTAANDDSIYFAENGHIHAYRMRNTIGDLAKLKITSEYARYFELNIWNDELYFTRQEMMSRQDDADGMYKMVSGNPIKISDDVGEYVNIVDGWIYYALLSLDEQMICKMRTDGSGKTILNKDVRAFYLQVVDDWIYYSHGGVNRLSRNGTRIEKICEYLDYLNVVGDFLYGTDMSKIIRINLKTGLREVLVTGTSVSPINVVNKTIYYCDHEAIFKIDTDTREIVRFNNTSSSSYLAVHGAYIYYEEFGDNYRVHIDGTEKPQKI
jgi:hypothetical protein